MVKVKKVPELWHKDIAKYIRSIENDKPLAGKDLHAFAKLVRNAYEADDSYFNKKQYEAYIAIGEAMYPKGLMPWEKCLCGLLLCTYKKSDDRPRWKNSLIMIGRGAGKDGFIAWLGLCMISRHNPIEQYDVDVCANNEDQAMRPVKDAIDFLNKPEFKEANKASFYWTSAMIRGLTNGGYIKGHTNNPKGKDGLRSGCIILNEIHQYESHANINVFTTGLGKKENPRAIYVTTNGDVRDGVLDEELRNAEEILKGTSEDMTTLPFLCRLDSKKEVMDPKNWVKANPSLPYMPSLEQEIKEEFIKWKQDHQLLPAFMSKRMNVPDIASDKAVAEYEQILKTNRPLPDDLRGCQCIVGIDTCKTSDMEAVTAIFKRDGFIYALTHTWVCTSSKDWGRMKVVEAFPKWVDMGLLTIVDDVEISPKYVQNYINDLKTMFRIQMVCIDDFRYTLFSSELSDIGFSKMNGNLKLVRPNDISKAVPIIESLFNTEHLICGDDPIFRWACNNTKVYVRRANGYGNPDIGNRGYAKIEAKSRKTDTFMSFVHAMTAYAELKEAKTYSRRLLSARSY